MALHSSSSIAALICLRCSLFFHYFLFCFWFPLFWYVLLCYFWRVSYSCCTRWAHVDSHKSVINEFHVCIKINTGRAWAPLNFFSSPVINRLLFPVNHRLNDYGPNISKLLHAIASDCLANSLVHNDDDVDHPPNWW